MIPPQTRVNDCFTSSSTDGCSMFRGSQARHAAEHRVAADELAQAFAAATSQLNAALRGLQDHPRGA
jgi:hypothetical protein